MKKIKIGCRSLLKFYTISEHASYLVDSNVVDDVNIAEELLSLAILVSNTVVSEFPGLLTLWKKLVYELNELFETNRPVPSLLVKGAYLLATYTWQILKLEDYDVVRHEKKEQLVTVHSLEAVLNLLQVKESQWRSIDLLVEHLLSQHKSG